MATHTNTHTHKTTAHDWMSNEKRAWKVSSSDDDDMLDWLCRLVENTSTPQYDEKKRKTVTICQWIYARCNILNPLDV